MNDLMIQPFARPLDEDGFTVIPDVVPKSQMAAMSAAYDRAVRDAAPPDMRIGRTTTRVSGLVNRGAPFDGIHLHPAILEACRRTIGQSFTLSTLIARTLHPNASLQDVHVDFARDGLDGWPMVGFIVMVDEFRSDNGATRFLPGSHREGVVELQSIREDQLVAACGSAG